MRKLSVKRAKQNREYLDLRKAYFYNNPLCEVKFCDNLATEIHHKKGRIGKLLTDTSNFLAVCRQCHQKIELNPIWAKEQGYSKSRPIVFFVSKNNLRNISKSYFLICYDLFIIFVK